MNLDDTTRCPIASECEECGCGITDNMRGVVTYDSPLGVFCGTVCFSCAWSRGESVVMMHPLGLMTVALRVLEHCTHLECDLDEMAAALEAEHSA